MISLPVYCLWLIVPFTLSGDGEIRARVICQSACNRGVLNPLAQAGVMLRESLDPGSRQVLLHCLPEMELRSCRD